MPELATSARATKSKIHVVRRAHGIEKLRYSPADTGKRPLQNAFVLVEIGVVEPGNLLVPENKICEGNSANASTARQAPAWW